jgi:hypothetical protein
MGYNGYMKDEMNYTTQRVSLRNMERLKKFGKYGDSFDIALGRVLSIAEMEEALQQPGVEPPS